MYGIQLESCSDAGGGQNVGHIDTGDYLVFNNIDFGASGVKAVDARIASSADIIGKMEFRLNAVDGTLIGSISFENTGGWQSWKTTKKAEITQTTGVHNLYIVFKDGGGEGMGNLNWVRFYEDYSPFVNAFDKIETEDYDSINGAQKETCDDAGGGSSIGFTKNNGYLEFKNVDFGTGALSVDVRFASQADIAGIIEFRLGSTTGALIGSIALESSGGWQTYTTRKTEITGASGVNDLFLVFKEENIGNINWIQFSKDPVPAPQAPYNLSVLFGDSFVTLSWSASYDAKNFTVKRALSSDGSYTAIETGLTEMEYTDAGLTNGVTYYYVVSASNSTGESENSSYIRATPVPDSENSFVKVVWSSEKSPADANWYKGAMEFQYKLTPMQDLNLTDTGSEIGTVFNVDTTVVYQTMHGFGASLEETSIYNLMLMSDEKRKEALHLLLDPETGAGMNLMRICMGTSDFTGRSWYTYNDLPAGETDMELSKFSIQKDIDYNIIKVLKEAMEINPDMRFFASPWSMPAWMKTSGSITGGTLKSGMYEVVAKYFAKFIKAYEEQGIPVWAMTLQNEPGHENGSMPTMGLNPQQEIEMVKAIKAEFVKQGISTKLWIHDHNFDNALTFPGVVLNDAEAYAATDGTAFHDYGGEPTEMTKLHDRFPDKEIFFTERSVWGTQGMDRIAQYIRNWACTYNAWVSMIDQDNNPNNGPFYADPTFLIKGTDSADSYWVIPELYLTGQYSKFVQPGAKRVESNYGESGGLTNVTFQNPDNEIVMVMINRNSNDQQFTVNCHNNQFKGKIAAKTVGTYRWKTKQGATSQIKEVENNKGKLTIYPNPVTNGSINITLNNGTDVETGIITISDINGKTVYKNEAEFMNGNKSVKLLLPDGLYIVSVKTQHTIATGKLIIGK